MDEQVIIPHTTAMCLVIFSHESRHNHSRVGFTTFFRQVLTVVVKVLIVTFTGFILIENAHLRITLRKLAHQCVVLILEGVRGTDRHEEYRPLPRCFNQGLH